MSQRADQEHIFVQCLPGLEGVLQLEARRLGAVHVLRDQLERAGAVELLCLLLDVPAGVVEKSRCRKVLFDRDDPHGR